MMKFILLFTVFFISHTSLLAVDIGGDAPDFTLQGSDGKAHKLSDYRGKTVVLEWFNNDCPFVRKHYESGNMQSLQDRFTKQGVVWLSVVSSAPGKQGHVDRAGALALKRQNDSHQTAILLDPEGSVGKAYGARTTPHMYLISQEGDLLYQGAIDDKPSADRSDIEGAQNYIALAVEAAMKSEKVEVAQTRPYGCSVKYE